jgi:hypothetical protein
VGVEDLAAALPGTEPLGGQVDSDSLRRCEEADASLPVGDSDFGPVLRLFDYGAPRDEVGHVDEPRTLDEVSQFTVREGDLVEGDPLVFLVVLDGPAEQFCGFFDWKIEATRVGRERDRLDLHGGFLF